MELNRALATALVVCCVAPAAEAATFDVFDTTGLRAALGNAQSGATIRLHPGTYGDIALFRRHYGPGRVTLVAATSTRPVITSFSVQDSSGIIVSGIDFRGDDRPIVNIFNNSRDIVFSGVRFYGTTINQDPWDDPASALWVRGSSSVTIFSCLFQDVKLAAFVQRSDKVVFMRNTIAFVREGVNIAATANSRFSGNYFHSFYPNYAEGDHPDAIQGWTRNETVGITDTEFASNAIITGGSRAIQGIFIRSDTEQDPDGPQVYHERLNVIGNVYFGSSVHGITMGSVRRSDIRNNAVVASPWGDRNSGERSGDGRSSGGYQTGIRAYSGSFNHIVQNISVTAPGGDSSGNRTDNIDIWDPVFQRGVSWTSVLPARPTTEVPAITSFVTRAGTGAATARIGVLRSFPHGAFREDPALTLPRAMTYHLP